MPKRPGILYILFLFLFFFSLSPLLLDAQVSVVVDDPSSSKLLQLQFISFTPDVRLLPKDSKGAVHPHQAGLLVSPLKITEIDNTGDVVATYPITGPYTITSNIDDNNNDPNQRFYFTAHAAAAGQVSINYTLFAERAELSAAGVTYTSYPSTLQFEMSLHSWKKSQHAHTLRFHLTLSVTPGITFSAQNEIGPGLTSIMLQKDGFLTASVHVIQFALVDNQKKVPIGFSLLSPSSSSARVRDAASAAQRELLIVLPPFRSSLQFTLPHISAVLHEDIARKEVEKEGKKKKTRENEKENENEKEEYVPLRPRWLVMTVAGLLLVGSLAGVIVLRVRLKRNNAGTAKAKEN